MRVITGTHEVKTGRLDNEKKPILETVVDTVDIPDEPKSVSDFPEKAIAAIGAPREDGTVCVVTVDGKKFYVKPERSGRQPAPPASHGGDGGKPAKE